MSRFRGICQTRMSGRRRFATCLSSASRDASPWLSRHDMNPLASHRFIQTNSTMWTLFHLQCPDWLVTVQAWGSPQIPVPQGNGHNHVTPDDVATVPVLPEHRLDKRQGHKASEAHP